MVALPPLMLCLLVARHECVRRARPGDGRRVMPALVLHPTVVRAVLDPRRQRLIRERWHLLIRTVTGSFLTSSLLLPDYPLLILLGYTAMLALLVWLARRP